MTTPVLICDDSSFARKQMARALPKSWDIDISFAENGLEGLQAIREGKGEIVFLDLNMPVMDGYETLSAILKEDLPAMVIVVSGDIQPEAHTRVKSLGALEFIKKPVEGEQISEILTKYGIDLHSYQAEAPRTEVENLEYELSDSYKELANVASGRAADLLARLLEVFVVMPIPTVSVLEVNDLKMTLEHVAVNDSVSAVCQGFIGSGIAGEALLVFNDSSMQDMATMMKHEGEINEVTEIELLMDLSSVLCNACLRGIAEQLDISFSMGHPVVLGQHVNFDDLLHESSARWSNTLAIEMGYKIENHNINCDLMLLVTEDSIDKLNDRVSLLEA